MTLVLPYGAYAGINGPLLRMAAAKLADMDSAKLYDLAVVLGVSTGEAKPAWEQLVADGFIETSGGISRPTARMSELATARFGKPLPRKKAGALIKKALEAAKALNALPPEAPYYWITRLAVFGSYLDADKSELGDLDLAWEVEERPGVRGHAHMATMYNRDGMQTTRAKVIPRGPYVRLVSFREMLSLGCEYNEFYSFESEELMMARVVKAEEFERYRLSLIDQARIFSIRL